MPTGIHDCYYGVRIIQYNYTCVWFIDINEPLSGTFSMTSSALSS